MNGMAAPLAARGLKPVGELASSREHGDRLRYMAGCRCQECRRANSAYENARQKARRNGDWKGLVSAAKARAHILKLSHLGVGREAVAAASDVSRTVITEIRSGEKQNIRARTERKILAVTKAMASDGALIPAKKTWKLIDELLEEGYTMEQLAQRLGYKSCKLQFGRDFITVRNAYRVERLYRQLHARLINSDDVCVDAAPTRNLIRKLRAEMYSAMQIAAEIGLEGAVEDGELRIVKKIPRRLENLVAALYERWMS